MKAFKALLLIPLIPVIIILFIIDAGTNPIGDKTDRLLNSILS